MLYWSALIAHSIAIRTDQKLIRFLQYPRECISLDTSEVISKSLTSYKFIGCSFEVIIDEFIISDEFYQFYDMNLNWMTGILEVPRCFLK